MCFQPTPEKTKTQSWVTKTVWQRITGWRAHNSKKHLVLQYASQVNALLYHFIASVHRLCSAKRNAICCLSHHKWLILYNFIWQVMWHFRHQSGAMNKKWHDKCGEVETTVLSLLVKARPKQYPKILMLRHKCSPIADCTSPENKPVTSLIFCILFWLIKWHNGTFTSHKSYDRGFSRWSFIDDLYRPVSSQCSYIVKRESKPRLRSRQMAVRTIIAILAGVVGDMLPNVTCDVTGQKRWLKTWSIWFWNRTQDRLLPNLFLDWEKMQESCFELHDTSCLC